MASAMPSSVILPAAALRLRRQPCAGAISWASEIDRAAVADGGFIFGAGNAADRPV